MLLVSHYYATRSAAQGVKQLVRFLQFLFQLTALSAEPCWDVQARHYPYFTVPLHG